MPLTRENKSQILSRIDRFVREKFYDPNFNGRDWGQLVAKYRERIIDSPSTEAFEKAVRDLLSELHSFGTGFFGPHSTITPRNAIAASFRRIPNTSEGDRWVFQDVQPGGPAARAGVKPGDVLIAIKGVDATPPVEPAFQMRESIPIVVSRDGDHKQLTLDLRTPKPKYRENPYAEPSVEANVIPRSLAYLKVALIPGKIGIDFANQLDAIFNGKFHDADRLLVDLRGNPGGGVGGMRLMSYFLPGQQPIGYSLGRKCLEKHCDPQKLPRFGHIPKSKWEIPLLALKYGGKRSVVLQTEGRGPRKFHGRIALLVNEHTSGAAEMIALFAKENRLATIVGTKTSGRLAAWSRFKPGFGYRLTIPVAAFVSWKGTQIEGQGIEPDVSVDWSFPDAAHGHDVQLERAIEVTNSL